MSEQQIGMDHDGRGQGGRVAPGLIGVHPDGHGLDVHAHQNIPVCYIQRRCFLALCDPPVT